MHEQMNNIKKKTKTIKIEKSTPYSKPYASIKKPENWFEWVFLGSSSINGSTNQLPKNPQNIYVIYLNVRMQDQTNIFNEYLSLWKNAFYISLSTGSKRTSIKHSQKTGTCVSVALLEIYEHQILVSL